MSQAVKERQETRQADFKRGIDGDDARRNRDEGLMSIRKNKREDKLAKRRQQEAPATPGGTPAVTMTSAQQAQASTPQDMQAWIAKLHGNSFEEVFAATVHFRKLLSLERNPPIQNVIDANIVPQLVKLCTATQYPKLQYEAAWALTNIASGTSAQTKAVVDQGAVPVFVQLLRSPDETVREQAIWALGNIAGDSPTNRDGVLKAGALQGLLLNLQHASKVSMLRNATWTLSNFARGKPQPEFALVEPALPALAKIIQSSDEEVLTDACWALSYMSDGSNDRMVGVVRAGVLKRLTELLNHSSASIQTPALRTIGNIATGNDQLTDAVLQAGAVPMLVALVKSQRKGVRKEALWTLSNIAAGSKEQIQTIIDAGGIPEIVRQMIDGEWEIKKEATWVVSNLTSGGSVEQIRAVVGRNKVIKPLVDLLECKEPKIILIVLEALKNILKAGQPDASSKFGSSRNLYTDEIEDLEGLDRIEKLQEHSNEKIYTKAVEIIEQFFADEGEGENFGGATSSFQPNGQFVFGGEQTFGASTAPFNFATPANNAFPAVAPPTGGGFQFNMNGGGNAFSF